MSNVIFRNQEHLGRVWLPAISISRPGTPTAGSRLDSICVASIRRSKAAIQGLLPNITVEPEEMPALLAPYKEHLNPELWAEETVYASVTHNARTVIGAALQFNKFLGVTTGTTGAVPSAVAIANANAWTIAADGSDLSIGSASANATTNEFTTLNMSRAVGTFGSYTAATVSDGTASITLTNGASGQTASGSGTSTGSALFDSATVAGSHLWCEAAYTSAAFILNDVLLVTWTITM